MWVDLRLVSSGARFHPLQNRFAHYRFAAISGHTASYDYGALHLDLTPKSNGDKTITITIAVREEAAGSPPVLADVQPFTVIENRSTRHEVDDLRLRCIATTDLQFLPSLDRQRLRTTFIEGTYVTAANISFVNDCYTFSEDGRFIDRHFSDAGGSSSFEGHYEIDGERIFLRFENSKRDNCIFTHLIVDDVHVLMDIGERPNAPNKPHGSGGYVLLPDEAHGDLEAWWDKLLAAHPRFAKALPGGGK